MPITGCWDTTPKRFRVWWSNCSVLWLLPRHSWNLSWAAPSRPARLCENKNILISSIIKVEAQVANSECICLCWIFPVHESRQPMLQQLSERNYALFFKNVLIGHTKNVLLITCILWQSPHISSWLKHKRNIPETSSTDTPTDPGSVTALDSLFHWLNLQTLTGVRHGHSEKDTWFAQATQGNRRFYCWSCAWKTGGFCFPPKLLLKTKSQQRNQEFNSDEASSSLHW